MKKTAITLFLLFFTIIIYGQISVAADETKATYEVGESMNFLVDASSSGLVYYEIGYDRFTPPLATGTVFTLSGSTSTIPFVLNEPGHVFCWVYMDGTYDMAGASFAPFDIEPLEEDPIDFDQFWNAQKQLLAAIPIDPVLTFEEENDYSTTYRINLANVDERRVYGYLSVPNGDGPFPAILELPPYGSAAGIVQPDEHIAERAGVLALSINIHNAEPDEEDPFAYEPDVIDDPAEIYFRHVLLAGIRAIDYLFTRSDFDGENIGVVGVSQGGGLSLMMAGLDDRINLLAQSNAALCEHTGFAYNKAAGFPYYLKKSDNEVGTQEHFDATLSATKYFDAMRFAKRYNGPSLNIVSYRDSICPPASNFAAINELKGPKVVLHARDLGHSHPQEYFSGRYDLFRRYYPATLDPPWPWPDTTTGYYIDAGEDAIIDIIESLTLEGLVELNNLVNTDFPVQWDQVSGPGTASFSNPQNHVTEVSFDEAGTYLLRFIAIDDYDDQSDKYYSIVDHIEVQVNYVISIETEEQLPIFKIAPNPTSGICQIQFLSNDWNAPSGRFQIFDLQGKNVYEFQKTASSSKIKLDLSHLPEGAYYIRWQSEKGNRSDAYPISIMKSE